MTARKTPTDVGAAIEIDRIEAETIRVPLIGTAPLIVHRFGEKAKRQMLDAMQGRAKVKTVRDPDADYQACLYLTKSGQCGFPTVAFKNATVSGARFYAKLAMTELRQFLFFHGEMGVDGQALAVLDGDHRMREDVVRLQGKTADLRYRAEFPEWSTVVDITFVTSSISRSSVLSLIDAGGMGVGVGEWRPEKKGEFGTYRIDPTRDVEVIS